MATPRELRFCWWNVQDFAHFDPNRSAIDRWPSSIDQHHEKRRCVEAAFDVMFGTDVPDVIGLCEITKAAAENLRKRKLPDHQLILSEPAAPLAFQVALFIRRNADLTKRPPLIPTDVSSETRPMCVASFDELGTSILFVACHWPPFSEPRFQESRRRCADALRRGVYDFLNPRKPAAGSRHVIAFGDFNAEPFDELFELTLYASRDRDHARRRQHHKDEDVRRTRLYNCGWRLLEERTAHGWPEPSARDVGTFYQAVSHTWRTYDQVLVSGGLLGNALPRFDEAALQVRTDAGNLVEGKPAKFAYDQGGGTGLSDHYPLSGRIVLG